MKLGAVVVGYHQEWDLAEFCDAWTLHADVLSALVIVNVEATKRERELADVLADQVSGWFINFPDNCGYGHACNSAAAMLLREFPELEALAFFNADTRLREDVLRSCLDLLNSDPDYGVVGPRQLNSRGLITHAGIVHTSGRPQHRGFMSLGTPHAYTDVLDDVWSVSGSAYFVKASVWEDLTYCSLYQAVRPATGAFLETEHFYEDEWCSRHAVAHFYKVVYNGASTMVHNQGGATPSGDWAMRKMRSSRATYEDACRVHGIRSA